MRQQSGKAVAALASALILGACTSTSEQSVATSATTTSETPSGGAAPGAEFVRDVVVTEDEQGGGARPEVIATADRVFVVYLAEVQSPDRNRQFRVKVFTKDFGEVITSRTLVETTTTYGAPTDIRVSSNGTEALVTYETGEGTSGKTYLRASLNRLDDSFTELASTEEPLATGPLYSTGKATVSDGEEVLDDPAPVLDGDTPYVLTRIWGSLHPEGETIYRLRQLDASLEEVARRDLDLSDVADGRARVNSVAATADGFLMSLPTTVSTIDGLPDSFEPASIADLLLVRFDRDWNVQGEPVRISDDAGDNSGHASGLQIEGAWSYAAYRWTDWTNEQQQGGRSTAIKVAVLDEQGRPVGRVTVTERSGNPGAESRGDKPRPSLEVHEDLMYVGDNEAQNAVIRLYRLSGTG